MLIKHGFSDPALGQFACGAIFREAGNENGRKMVALLTGIVGSCLLKKQDSYIRLTLCQLD